MKSIEEKIGATVIVGIIFFLIGIVLALGQLTILTPFLPKEIPKCDGTIVWGEHPDFRKDITVLVCIE